MPDPLDELTVQYEDDGVILVRELKKAVLSRGAWATIMFLYQDLDRKTGSYKSSKVSIRRYKKNKGRYIFQNKFNISSERQARQICEVIETWFGPSTESVAVEFIDTSANSPAAPAEAAAPLQTAEPAPAEVAVPLEAAAEAAPPAPTSGVPVPD